MATYLERCGLGDAHAIVFDNGTSNTKLGIAPVTGGDPKLFSGFPTIYGKAKELAAMETVASADMERVGNAAQVSYHKVPSNYTYYYSPFILRQLRESRFFQNCGTFNTNQNKKYHNF